MADASEPEQEVSRGVIRRAKPGKTKSVGSFTHTRRVSPRTQARFLAIALEFQLGADILSTAVAPSWDAIGKLGAIPLEGECGVK